MTISLLHIGERIEEILREKNMSRASLGKELNVGEGAVGRYIRGEADPGAASLAKIAEIGGKSTDWLITGKNKTPGREEIREDTGIYEALSGWPFTGATAYNRRATDSPIKKTETTPIVKKEWLRQDLVELLDYWEVVDEGTRDNALGMLKHAAEKSRASEGGGSECKTQKSA